ncbi:MAG TPA: hypothetical protein VFW07_04500, partial [Parafilimonas sp.]|nr:hypothetical protein [Parafilimonas sp.]
NTMPFEHSTFGRFAHSCCKACAAVLLPSFIQLQNLLKEFLVTHSADTEVDFCLLPKITTNAQQRTVSN